MKIRGTTLLSVLTTLFIWAFINGCEIDNSNLKQDTLISDKKGFLVKPPEGTQSARPVCEQILGSQCTADQEEYLKHFFWRFEGSLTMPIETRQSPPALEILPKDQFGYVNWTKSVMDGIINPKDSLTLGKDVEEDKPFDLLVFFQAQNAIMADVIFPHSVHNYWLSCRNCHPKIFKPMVGSNPVSMKAIRQGKYCGKCHGKVAFPMDPPVEQCRRCHALLKKPFKD